MRKYRHIAGLWLIASSVALADPWLSQTNTMDGSYERGNQALSGACERASVCLSPSWTNSLPSTNWWRAMFIQHKKLVATKNLNRLAINTGRWVRPSATWHPTNSVTITESNILAWCGAPTNYWDKTPWFSLATDSNGWMFIPHIESNLVWMSGRLTNGISDFLFKTMTYTGNYTDTAIYFPEDAWPDIITDAENNYTSFGGSGDYYIGQAAISLYESPIRRFVSIINYESSNRWELAGSSGLILTTNKDAHCSVWGLSSVNGLAVYPSCEYHYGDQGSDAAGTNWGVWVSNDRYRGQTNSPVFRIGDITANPYQYIAPSTTYHGVTVGWAPTGYYYLLSKFNKPGLTNGFHWFP